MVCWLVDCMNTWFVGWLVVLLVGALAREFFGDLVKRLVGWLGDF